MISRAAIRSEGEGVIIPCIVLTSGLFFATFVSLTKYLQLVGYRLQIYEYVLLSLHIVGRSTLL